MVQEYALPETPEEAARLVAEDPSALICAGGTTLMPDGTLGGLSERRVIGLERGGLDGVRRNGTIRIGAMVRLRELAGLPELPALAGAAASIGAATLRNTATVGGNLLVDPPYGDLAPLLLALDAELRIAGAKGERELSLDAALADGGALGSGELLIEIAVPETRGGVSFRRCARLARGAPPIVTVAARIARDNGAVTEARLAIGAVGDRAGRVKAAEEALIGSAGDDAAIEAAVEAAAAAARPADDAIASAWYRTRMLELHVRRALAAALEGEANP